MQSHVRHSMGTRFPYLYTHHGYLKSQTLTLIGFLPAGYAGTGHPLSSLHTRNLAPVWRYVPPLCKARLHACFVAPPCKFVRCFLVGARQNVSADIATKRAKKTRFKFPYTGLYNQPTQLQQAGITRTVDKNCTTQEKSTKREGVSQAE